jgi:MFS family permease
LIFPLMMLVKEPERPTTHRGAVIPESSFKALITTPGVLKKILWGSAGMAFGFGAYYGLTGLYSTLLKGQGLDMSGVSFHVALFNVGMMVGAIGCGWLAMKRGVAPAILIPTLAMAVCVPLYVGAVPGLLAVGAFVGGLFGAGYSGTTPLMLTSLFPDHLRARSVGIVYHLGAVPAAFVPMSIAALSEKAGFSLGFSIGLVVVVSVLGLAALVAFGPAEIRARPSADASVH